MRGGASESKALDMASHRSVGSLLFLASAAESAPSASHRQATTRRWRCSSAEDSCNPHHGIHYLYHAEVLNQLKKFRTHAQSQSTQLMVNEIDFQNGFH